MHVYLVVLLYQPKVMAVLLGSTQSSVPRCGGSVVNSRCGQTQPPRSVSTSRTAKVLLRISAQKSRCIYLISIMGKASKMQLLD